MKFKKVFCFKFQVSSFKFQIKLFVLAFTFYFLLFTFNLFSQGIGINIIGAPADPSAILDASSTNQGMLVPRMTQAERDAIAAPVESLLIYDTDTQCFETYNVSTSQWIIAACMNNIKCAVPLIPTAGVNITSGTQITWNWNAVSGATGYKWNTANNYATAVNNGLDTSYTQTGLNYNSTYTLYVWAYNRCGNSSSAALTQIVPLPTCGSQVWAAANANAGSQIPGKVEQTSFGEKWCYWDLPANCITYGGLYEWASVVNVAYSYNNSMATGILGAANENCDPCGPSLGHGGIQGICPAGFHIPSDLEWSRWEYCLDATEDPVDTNSATNTLSYFQNCINAWCGSKVDGVGPGNKMQGGGAAMWGSPYLGNNVSGFNWLPAGFGSGGTFQNLNAQNYIWTATEAAAQWAMCRFFAGGPQIYRRSEGKINGMSLRCIKDQ